MAKTDTWSKETRIIVFSLTLISLVALLWYFREAISPLATAALIAYVMNPVADFLAAKTRLKRKTAVVIVFVIMLLFVAAIPAMMTPFVVNQIQAMELDMESLMANYADYVATPITFWHWTVYPSQFLPDVPDASTNLLAPMADVTFRVVEFVGTNSIWIMIELVTIYYLMQDGHKITDWIIRIMPDAFRSDAEHLIDQLRHVWDDYLRSQLLFMFIVGFVDTLVWLAVGLPGAVLLGVFTGLTSFVHEIGAIVSGIFSVAAALLGGSHFLPLSNFWFAVVVLILYLILTGIKNFYIRPVVVGRHVHLHSGIVFVIILVALLIHGALAAFIAVPVFVSLIVIGRYLRRRILGKPPFPAGEDPSEYFSIQPPAEDEHPPVGGEN